MGELAGMFGSGKPLSKDAFVKLWCSPWRKNNKLWSFKVGLPFYALWEIWRTRNKLLHDEPVQEFNTCLMHWARAFIDMIPGLQKDSRNLKTALYYFNINDISRSLLTGK